MAQRLQVGHLHHLAVLLVQVGMRDRVLRAQLMDDGVGRRALDLQVFQAQAALHHRQPQLLLAHEGGRAGFPFLFHHQVETRAAEIALDGRLPFRRHRLDQVAQHLRAGAGQIAAQLLQRMPHMGRVVSAAFGQVGLARRGVALAAQRFGLGAAQLRDAGVQRRDETVVGPGQRCEQLRQRRVGAVQFLHQHQRTQHIGFGQRCQPVQRGQRRGDAAGVGSSQRISHRTRGARELSLLRGYLHTGHVAGRGVQPPRQFAVLPQRGERGGNAAVKVANPAFDTALLLDRRDAHHLRMHLREAAPARAAVLLKGGDHVVLGCDRRLQAGDGGVGPLHLAQVVALRQRRGQQLRLRRRLVRGRRCGRRCAQGLDARHIRRKPLAFLAQAVDLPHQPADLAYALRQHARVQFQHLAPHQLVDAADGLVRDRLAPGLGRALGLGEGHRLLAAKAAV